MRWALRQSQSYFPKLELGVHCKKQIQTWGRRNPVFAVRTGPVAFPGALLPLAKAPRAQRLRFCSRLHPAAGPARALQETQTVSKWAVLGCGRDVKLKGSPNMSAQPLVTSSNPKPLLQALDLCTDVGTGVSPNLTFRGSGKVQDENSVMRIPSPLPGINLRVVLEPQSPLPALSLALVGSVSCSRGCRLLQQNPLSCRWEFSQLVSAQESQPYLRGGLRSTPGKIPPAPALTGSGGVLSWLPGNGCCPQAVSSGDPRKTLQFPFFHAAVAISLFF